MAADKPSVTTVTIPEAVFESLIDLKNTVGRVLAVEARRRRYSTLEQPPKAIKANADLYDQLTGLQRDYEFASRATAGLCHDDIADAEIADNDVPF